MRRKVPFLFEFMPRYPWGIDTCLHNFIMNAVSNDGGILMIPVRINPNDKFKFIEPAYSSQLNLQEVSLHAEYDNVDLYKGDHFLSVKVLYVFKLFCVSPSFHTKY